MRALTASARATCRLCPSCGHAWTHYTERGGKRTYTSEDVVQRYRAIYGDDPFKPVRA